jgi:hypothetical protein
MRRAFFLSTLCVAVLALASVGSVAPNEGVWCFPGGRCAPALVLKGGTPSSDPAAPAVCVRTFLERAEFEEFVFGPDIPAQMVLAVDVRIEDPTFADHVEVWQDGTVLRDASGRSVSDFVGHPEYERPKAAMSADGRFEGPRIVNARLWFEPPPPDAPHPLYLDLRLRRFQDCVVRFEWRDVGPNPGLPLTIEKGGIQLTLEKMEVTDEPAEKNGPRVPHLVVHVSATNLRPGTLAPIMDFEAMKLMVSEDEFYRPTHMRGRSDSERAMNGDVWTTSSEMSYHFTDLPVPPADIKDILVEIRKPWPSPEPFVHALPAIGAPESVGRR